MEGLERRALQSILTVTSAADSGAGSLRALVAAAKSGDVVTFSPKLDGQTITLTSGEIAITPGTAIQGPGPGLLTISGNGSSRIFEIQNNNIPEYPTTISGLSLFDGSAPSGAAIENTNSFGPLVVSDCYFAENTASWAGGAIECDAPLSVDQCIFLYNRVVGTSSSNGGGGQVASGGAILSGSFSLEVTNSKFYDNSAKGADYADLGGSGFGASGGAVD
jgi:hypothetical protein